MREKKEKRIIILDGVFANSHIFQARGERIVVPLSRMQMKSSVRPARLAKRSASDSPNPRPTMMFISCPEAVTHSVLCKHLLKARPDQASLYVSSRTLSGRGVLIYFPPLNGSPQELTMWSFLSDGVDLKIFDPLSKGVSEIKRRSGN